MQVTDHYYIVEEKKLVQDLKTRLITKYETEANDLKRVYEQAFSVLRDKYIKEAKKILVTPE